MILFDGVDCPGVAAAFEQHAGQGKAKLHRAVLIDGKPGLFEYKVEGGGDFGSTPPLVNGENETCLLLRTSGTTARPKGVPLRQGT